LIIDISQRKNPKLVDKTDREGLILNEEFEDFSSLVMSAISELETYRRKDKVDDLRERKKGKKLTSTLDAIENLKSSMDAGGVLEKYDDLVTEIEKTTSAPPSKFALNEKVGIEIGGKKPKRKIIHDGY
jgi:hypothetical protein